MLLAEEREALAEAGRRLAARGLVIGTSGNLSARRGDLVALTPTGAVISELSAAQLTVISLQDGAIAEGELEPTSEVPMHLAIYRATGAGAVAHTHAATSTAIGLVCEEIPLIHYAMLSLGGALRVAPYATYGTEQLAGHVVAALQYRQAALLRNHGSIALGSSVAKAVDNLELAEWCAETYARALSISAALHGPLDGPGAVAPRELTQKEQEDVINVALATGYGTTKKITP
ncbi:class II aldolase/adducin family protein [Actinocrinis puniceicyclus]|uniref:Class II aldolase/adducin family protein n=1 Tax=Actinocrinis puniceicyclus TaxID=977794 RepID=A0A8J7WWB2_9ACTN|nr:class II aldolase/adducin family protein [Actinocrinis puniceicyclus]MBS2966304.1 class II aldolase/adducin family protein [Actinocrinis puniceicyclus]